MSSTDLILRVEALNASSIKKILIVEDNQINAIVLKRILQKYHFDTFVAEDGKLGVEAVSSYKPDLILMDINMPIMNGIDATKAIRKLDPEFNKIPIFAVSADITEETNKISILAGMNEYIKKPVDVDDLLKLILDYLE